ncbi:MAG: ABC transporter permease [Gammaproteobacteria bacterium]|nr:MAG: ABC transporter permease [Gammaproteobacteria bacterium]
MSTNLLFELLISTGETLYMVLVSGLLAMLFGLPLGILLFSTRRTNLLPMPLFNKSLSILVNMARSIPFIILMLAIIPVTRFLVGTSIGTTAAIVPLSLAAMPFFARMIENNLNQLPSGLIETGLAMGASIWQIPIILLTEALPGMVGTLTTTFITLMGYSAMAGAVGGGGLGDLAIRYGYQRFDAAVMIITIAILIVLVQGIQHLGDYWAKRLNHH